MSATAGSGSYVDSRPSITEGSISEVLSAPVVAELEHAWHAIRTRHPEVPAVVVVLAAGLIGAPRGSLRLGHFAAMRWDHDTTDRHGLDRVPDTEPDRDALPEVFIGGEGWPSGRWTCSAPCCTRQRTPWPTPGASRTPAGKAATTTAATPPSPTSWA